MTSKTHNFELKGFGTGGMFQAGHLGHQDKGQISKLVPSDIGAVDYG